MKKNKLSSYLQFINESIDDSVVELLLERANFYDELRELDYSEFDISRSFSDACKSNNDPDTDFNNIQNYLGKKGFSLEKIKTLFSEENNRKLGYGLKELYFGGSSTINNEPLKTIMAQLNKKVDEYSTDSELILSQFKFYSGLDSLNAAVDIYLYKLFEKIGLDKNIVSLGGAGWTDWGGTESDEAFIRYRYGYHNTKYGQLMLSQNKATEEDLRQDALAYLQEFIEINFDEPIRKAYQNKYPGINTHSVMGRIEDIVYLKEFSIVEEDRYILLITDICDELNKLTSNKEYQIEPEDVTSEFTKMLSDLQIPIYFIGGDLVIYSTFKEN
jgi:hypothetical protein